MKTEILRMLKTADGYLSGEDLSRQLGVTRAAVWKTVQALRQDGYPIDASPRRGYRLGAAADILSELEIQTEIGRSGLSGHFATISFAVETDSTNLMARRAAESGAPDRSVFVAERQTAGRGRRGRSWLSDHRQGLWFTLLLRPQAEAASLAKITLIAGLCAAEGLQSLGADVGIKWPNDLVSRSNGRKIGGILTEMTVEENTVSSLIIGIGINLGNHEFPAELAPIATSLHLETGREWRRSEVLAAVLAALDHRLPAFGTDRWLDDYRRNCLTLGRDIRIIQADGTSRVGRAAGIDDEGELLIVDAAGNQQVIRSGEVSVRGLLGFS